MKALKGFSRRRPYLLFLAPFVVLFAVFTVYPIGLAVYLSFTDWTGSGEPGFVGWENYSRLFHDDSFYKALVNTLALAVFAVILIVPLAMVLAVALTRPWLRGRALLRTAFFLPIGTTTIAVALVFVVLFNELYGVANWLLGLVALGPVDWLGDPAWVKPTILVLLVWQWTAVPTIYFMAGLQGVPVELTDAARVDGAGPVAAFRHITLPLLRPVRLLVLVLLTNDAIRLFDQVFILTFFTGAPGSATGGPDEQGLTLLLYLYQVAFKYREVGYGAAVGMVVFALGFGIALIQIWRMRGLADDPI